MKNLQIIFLVIITIIVTSKFGPKSKYEGMTAEEWYDQYSAAEERRNECIDAGNKLYEVIKSGCQPVTQQNSQPQTTIIRELPKVDDCANDAQKYNSCLVKYNTEMIEYESCLTCKERGDFGCSLACIKPLNLCEKEIGYDCKLELLF